MCKVQEENARARFAYFLSNVLYLILSNRLDSSLIRAILQSLVLNEKFTLKRTIIFMFYMTEKLIKIIL